MSIEHADSFDIYGVDESLMTEGVYAQFTGSLVTDPDGESTQRCISIQGHILRYVLQTPNARVGVSMRIYMPSLPINSDSELTPIDLRDINNNAICRIQVQTTGAIKLIAGSNGDTFIVSTDSPVLAAEGWFHLEAWFTASSLALGEVEVRVEGVTVLEAELVDMPSDVFYQLRVTGETSGTGVRALYYVKDFVVANDLGSENNDFLGGVRVINLVPNADVTLGGWVPTPSGTGFSILDNNPPDNAQYLTADDTPPAAMVFGMTDLPEDISSVRGVVTFVRARKTDGGDGQMQVSMIGTGDEESPGTDRAITAAPVYWRDVHEQDPGTDAPWTRSAINAAEIKIDRTS